MCWLTFPSFKLDFFSHLLQVLNKTGLGLGGCPPPEMIFKGQGGWGLANHGKHMLGLGGGVAHCPVRMEGAQQARAPPWTNPLWSPSALCLGLASLSSPSSALWVWLLLSQTTVPSAPAFPPLMSSYRWQGQDGGGTELSMALWVHQACRASVPLKTTLTPVRA